MKNLLLILIAGLFMACSGPKVESSKIADGANLAGYKTYAFFDMDTSGLVNPKYYIENMEALKKSVAKEMQARGYTESADPDLKVNMGIVVAEKAQTRETDFRTDRPKYMGQRNYSWQSEEIVVGYYREGTLDFHLVDAKAGKMVWWATISDVLPEKQKNMAETINRNVHKLFEKYPVKPLK